MRVRAGSRGFALDRRGAQVGTRVGLYAWLPAGVRGTFFRMGFVRAQCLLLLGTSLAFGCDGFGEDDDPNAWKTSVELDFGVMNGVWGSSPDDVYVVGGSQDDPTDPGESFVLRRRGDRWQPQDLPPNLGMLHSVFGFGDQVWVGGHDGTVAVRSGGSWTQVDTGIDAPIRAMWGSRADDVWAVGGSVETGPAMSHFDGHMWMEVFLPEVDREFDALLDVWGTSRSNAFAVGENGVILQLSSQGWSQVESNTTDTLRSIWGSAQDHVLAAGGPNSATLVEYDGNAWTPQIVRTAGLRGVWVDPSGAATLVGQLGVAGRIAPDTDGFLLQTSPTDLVLNDVWGFETGEAFAVGGNAEDDVYPQMQGIIVVHGLDR